MKRTRSWSQQPNAGPSGLVKTRTRASFPQGVIELSDSEEDEQPISFRPAKRQKAVHASTTETIDLTVAASKHPDNDAATRTPTDAPRDKGKEKAFNDLTNDLDIQRGSASSSQLDASVSEEPVREAPVDPMDLYLSQVLEVVPDVQPDHARTLLAQHIQSHGTDVVAAVIHVLFEEPFPRIERNKGKRRQDETASVGDKSAENYGSKHRPFAGGEHYEKVAINQLLTDFPRIPLPHIRQTLRSNYNFYAPTHLTLKDQLTWNPPPFELKKTSSRVSGKDKLHDPEFERERAWLVETLQDKATQGHDAAIGGDESDGACEGGIECGCCFDTYNFGKMVQCPDAHLFCKECITSYAENQLGQHNPNIVCMDQGGCKLAFTDAELKRFLSSKLLELYERVKQAKEIEAAELDGLEECPFCEYKAVIENPDEKLFRCEHEDCGAVSCRSCKKLDHLPKSCKEAEEDVGLNARHKVEEAMTEALMRNCPKCKKAFIKEGGCNKMTCPNCSTLSCYICRQIIRGYDHFDQRPPGLSNGESSSSKKKCQLWDPVEQRHDQEVAAARARAIQDVENTNPEIDRNQLEVELPKTAPDADNARVGLVHLAPPNRLAHLRGVVQRMPVRVAGAGAAEGQAGGARVALDALPGLFGPVPRGQPQNARRPHAIARERVEHFRRTQEARRAALAEQREAANRMNEEIRRQVREHQELVRQQYEAQRQQVQALQALQERVQQPLQQRHPHRPERIQVLGQMQEPDNVLHRAMPGGPGAAVQQPGLMPCAQCGRAHAHAHPAPAPLYPQLLFTQHVPAAAQMIPIPFHPGIPQNGQLPGLLQALAVDLPQHVALPLLDRLGGR